MRPERWRRIEAVYLAAREHEAAARAAFLERECGSDRDLQQVVRRMLESDLADRFLEPPDVGRSANAETRGGA